MVQTRGLAVSDWGPHGNRLQEVAPSSESLGRSSLKVAVEEVQPAALPFAGQLSPGDKVIIGYLAILAAAIAIGSHRVPGWWLLILGHFVAAALVIALAGLSKTFSRAGGFGLLYFVRSWYPLALIPFTFKELTYLIPLLNPGDLDWELAALDYRLFGVHPTVWLEHVTWPFLTEILQLAYATYYFLPIIPGAVLWRQRRLQAFHFFLFVCVLAFYVSYFGYIAVPALGPRFILNDLQTRPLTGVLLFDLIHTMLNRLEGVTRDCFPSAHTAVTLLVLYYARTFSRRIFPWILPAGSLLVISTVYLRYHYVVDVVAGILLATVVIIVARPAYRFLGGRPPTAGNQPLASENRLR